MTSHLSKPAPVCVDLDGTLIKTDLLMESALILIKNMPWIVFFLPLWLLKGKSYLKAKIASLVDIDVSVLPYNSRLLDVLRKMKADGHFLILTTASNLSYANAIASHLQLFDDVIASSEAVNNSGKNKAAELVKRFGEKNFIYFGNATVDLDVWRHASHIGVVNAKASLLAKVNKLYPDAEVISDRKSFLLGIMKVMRLHQWVKNALIFVPLVASHQIGNFSAFVDAVLAFLAFGFCASSVYVLNDLLDLEADRHHSRKCNRGFASGQVSILAGIFMLPLLLVAAIAISVCFLPFNFLLALGLYYILTTVYSFWAKRRVMLDVMFLAGLYTMRLLAGSAANAIQLSFWLLAFSMFIFLSLALVKRYSELSFLLKEQRAEAKGRGYLVDDLAVLSSLGGASGYLAVLVLALYINSPEVNVLYAHPKALWGVCPLMLFWISRVWFKTHRNEMHDDPVVFAVKDKVSLLTALLFGVAFVIATIH